MPTRRLILGALLSLPLMGCSQDISQGDPPASSGPPQPTERPSVTLAPTPEFAAPPELRGTWEAVSDSGSNLVLVIRDTGYRLTQSSTAIGSQSATGRVEVDGDEIVFSNATVCNGDGRYRWSIEDDVLRFEPIGSDACPGRTGSVAGTAYARAE